MHYIKILSCMIKGLDANTDIITPRACAGGKVIGRVVVVVVVVHKKLPDLGI